MRDLLVYVGLAAILSACTIPLNGTGSGGLQIYPSSTSIAPGQGMTFQVSGGAPPYQYQVSGDGTVDTSGDFTAGTYTGSAQVAAVDTVGNTVYASISVLQAGSYNPYGSSTTVGYSPSYDRLRSVGLDPASGWTPADAREARSAPPLRGQFVAASEKTRPDGSVVESRFIDTNLKHSMVRLDEELSGTRVIATRAVVEDQFIAQLRPGYSESDLALVLKRADAHVSKRLDGDGGYLVSMNGQSGSALSAAFMTKRKALEHELQGIAIVTPRVLPARAPAKD